jgi:hypothetical protein
MAFHLSADHFLQYCKENNDYSGISERRYKFYLAVENGDMATIKDLHNKGIFPNGQALYLAANRGQLKVVEYLCENSSTLESWMIKKISSTAYDDVKNYLLKFIRDRKFCKNIKNNNTNTNANANAEERNPPNAQDCW